MSTRLLLTVAVSEYPDADDDFKRAIRDQVGVIKRWLLPTGNGFTQDLVEPGEDRPSRLLLRRAADLDDYGTDDVLFVYVTGHGERAAQTRQHWLLMPDGRTFETAHLVKQAVTCGAGHVVVLVDSCYAGTLYAEVDGMLQDRRQRGERLPTSCCVVVSGHPDQPTRLREFGRLIERVLQLLRSEKFAPPAEVAHLSPQQFHSALQEAARTEAVKPQWVWPRSLEIDSDPCLALPNPNYRPAEVITRPSVRDLGLTAGQVRGYWREKASGRTSGDDPGWYFAGRQALMRDLVSFLTDGRRPVPTLGLLVVTGEAGSGKSAVIARAVTLADPAFRAHPEFAPLVEAVQTAQPELCPPEGAVDAAVAARGLTPERVAAELVAALGVPDADESAPAATSLRHRVVRAARQASQDRRRPTNLVIDGVDEATDPATVVAEIIGPLTTAWTPQGTPVARLLVGLRSERNAQGGNQRLAGGLVAALTRAAEPVDVTVLRTDGADTGADITKYVTTVLLAGATPYAGDPAAALAAARVVSDHVTPRFLDARVAAAVLRDAKTRQNLTDPGWLAALTEGSIAQLRADLVQVAADTGTPWAHLVAVVRATALAQGAGLPWAHIWPAVTAAVHGADPESPDPGPDSDAVIRAVLNSRLAGYLTTSTEDGRRVWRPAHERLTETLRDHPKRLVPGRAP